MSSGKTEDLGSTPRCARCPIAVATKHGDPRFDYYVNIERVPCEGPVLTHNPEGLGCNGYENLLPIVSFTQLDAWDLGLQ